MNNKDNNMGESGNKKTIFFIVNRDISHIQGNTEKYYMAKNFSEDYDLHIFAPMKSSIEGATNHILPFGGIMGVFLINILFIPMWLYYFVTKRPELTYCYETVICPVIIGRMFNSTVAYDLRSDPFDQAWEFSKEDDRTMIFRLSLLVGKYLHMIALKMSDYVFVLSEPLANTVAKNYGISKNKLFLLPLGVDIKKFNPISRSHNRISIVYIGEINQRRGIEKLLEAVQGLPAELQTEVQIDLYGPCSDNYMASIISEVRDRSEVKIHQHGLIPHKKIPEKAGKSDIAVSPLLPYDAFEVSSPAKIFEYLSMGMPIIASKIEPHQRILQEDYNAIFYQPDSVQDLRDKLHTLIVDEDLRDRLSKNARQAAQEHSWEQRFDHVESTLGLTE